MGTVEPVAGQEFLGLVAEGTCREGIGEDERLGGGAQMYRPRGGGREGGVAGARSISGKPASFVPSWYRFDFEHITKLNRRQNDEHFGAVAVTLDAGEPLARAAIVDASGCRACRA